MTVRNLIDQLNLKGLDNKVKRNEGPTAIRKILLHTKSHNSKCGNW